MPKKCTICDKNAILKRPKTDDALCRECFFWAFEEEIHHTITSANLFSPGDTVAIGASGGKDSTVLAHTMKLLNDRHKYGLKLILLSVDEGITGYRDDSLETVKRNKHQYDLPLTIVSYEELYGWTMDAIVKQIGFKNNCTFCGVFRRQALDRGAMKVGANKIVTGHNADDIAETVIMNVLRGDIARLKRCTAIITGAEGCLPRCKPFKYTYEKEIVMYAYFKKLDYFSTECIYSPNAYRGFARTYIKDLEKLRPTSILDIIHSGECLSVKSEVKMPIQTVCQRCNFVSSNDICKACVMLEGLNQGRPRLGIGKITKERRKWEEELKLKAANEDTDGQTSKSLANVCNKQNNCCSEKSQCRTNVEDDVAEDSPCGMKPWNVDVLDGDGEYESEDDESGLAGKPQHESLAAFLGESFLANKASSVRTLESNTTNNNDQSTSTEKTQSTNQSTNTDKPDSTSQSTSTVRSACTSQATGTDKTNSTHQWTSTERTNSTHQWTSTEGTNSTHQWTNTERTNQSTSTDEPVGGNESGCLQLSNSSSDSSSDCTYLSAASDQLTFTESSSSSFRSSSTASTLVASTSMETLCSDTTGTGTAQRTSLDRGNVSGRSTDRIDGAIGGDESHSVKTPPSADKVNSAPRGSVQPSIEATSSGIDKQRGIGDEKNFQSESTDGGQVIKNLQRPENSTDQSSNTVKPESNDQATSTDRPVSSNQSTNTDLIQGANAVDSTNQSTNTDLLISANKAMNTDKLSTHQSTITDKLESTHQSTITDQSYSTHQSTITDKLESTHQSTITDKPDSTELSTTTGMAESERQLIMTDKQSQSTNEKKSLKPNTVDQSTVTDKTDCTEQSTITDKAESTHQSTITEKAESTHQSTITDKAESTHQSTITDKAESTHQSTITDKAESTHQSTITDKAESTNQSTITDKAESTHQSTITDKAESTHQSTITDKAESTYQSTLTDTHNRANQTISSDVACITNQPKSSDNPDSTNQSTNTEKTDSDQATSTEEFVSTHQSTNTDSLHFAKNNESTHQSTGTEKPESTHKSTSTEKPESTHQSTGTEKPESTHQSTITEKPESTHQSTGTDTTESTSRSTNTHKLETTHQSTITDKGKSFTQSSLQDKPDSTNQSSETMKPKITHRATSADKVSCCQSSICAHTSSICAHTSSICAHTSSTGAQVCHCFDSCQNDDTCTDISDDTDDLGLCTE